MIYHTLPASNTSRIRAIKGGYLFTLLLLQLTISIPSLAQLSSLPLIGINDLVYEGAFRIPPDNLGGSGANFCAGAIAYNSANESVFLAGYRLHGSVAEYTIPLLRTDSLVEDINTAAFLQPYRKILNEAPTGNPQNIDEISGMCVIDGKLIVNAVEYYDAPADNTHTTLVVETPNDLANSNINGYYSLGGAAHAGGWVSPIPVELQAELGGDYLAGHCSRYPINTRSPMGISAFSFNSADLFSSTSGPVPTITLADFDLDNPLYADYSDYENDVYNIIEVNGSTHPGHTFEEADVVVGENNLWTQNSVAAFSMLVPGTRTYLSLGSSGGHFGGIGYKPRQDNGNLCGGPCPYFSADNYHYYWLWDALDFVAVKNGTLAPHEVRPYAYGVLYGIPFQRHAPTNSYKMRRITGGSYDAENNRVYLVIYGAGQTGNWDENPVVAVYNLNVNSSPLPVSMVNFTANPEGNDILLQWQTETERNNDGFGVQRRIEGEREFQPIGWVPGVGDSEQTVHYTFKDKEAPRNVNCYYRLQQLDLDGSSSYSVMRVARLEHSSASVQVFPNPSSEWLTIVSNNSPINRVVMYDQLGRIVLEAGTDKINVTELPAGLYTVCTYLNNDELSVEKVVVY